MSKLTVMAEKGEVYKAWNFVLPEQHKPTRYSPIQSIPLLTKKNFARTRLRKRKTRNH
jgi:hypothetical protein